MSDSERLSCIALKNSTPDESLLMLTLAGWLALRVPDSLLTLSWSDQIETISRGPVSFEYIVSKGHERVGERQPEVIGCLEIEHEFVAAWLFEREFAWLGPAEHARGVDRETAIDLVPVT